MTAARPTPTVCFVYVEDSVSAGVDCAERGARRDLAKQPHQREEFDESLTRKGLLAYHKVRVWVKLPVEEWDAGRVEASDPLQLFLNVILTSTRLQDAIAQIRSRLTTPGISVTIVRSGSPSFFRWDACVQEKKVLTFSRTPQLRGS